MSDNIQFIDLDNLILDHQNPRLPESLNRDQDSMMNYIAESTSIEELMDVIAQNGYFLGEPVIAVPEKGNDAKVTGNYIVVEGNRRITALKLLQNPDAASTAGNRVHEIAQNPKSIKPTSIPVVVRDNREEILPYLGFRHITGIKQWEPLAKARYMEQILATTNEDLPLHERYAEVARIIGSRRSHIRRSLDALGVYKVIKNHDYFEIDNLNEEKIKFAVLSTALADERIGKFVGLGDGSELNIPVSNLNTSNIKELTKWLYEKDDKKGKTRVGESRNLKFLGAVVDNQRALAAFRNGAMLKVAYLQTADVTSDFIELLYSADTSLVEASSMVATLEYDEDAFIVAQRILDNIKLIGRELKNKKSPNDDEF
jgi:ParB-like chromosome segregation protein Spo0J